jgi:hypothetical protein
VLGNGFYQAPADQTPDTTSNYAVTATPGLMVADSVIDLM